MDAIARLIVPDESMSRPGQWQPDLLAQIDERYARTAAALEESLLRGETAPGNALDKLAAFLVAALDIRRERGSYLSFRAADGLPEKQRRRVRERELMILTRLKRLLLRGQRDSSLALRHVDSACAMILAALEVPATAGNGPEQRMWDGEMIELLLAALAEPHAPESLTHSGLEIVRSRCGCGEVQYEIDGPFDVMTHCSCAVCRAQQGEAFVHYVPVPADRFRFLSGRELITAYLESNDRRAFCSRCGSPAPLLDAAAGTALCPADPLKQALGVRPQSHVYLR